MLFALPREGKIKQSEKYTRKKKQIRVMRGTSFYKRTEKKQQDSWS